MVASPTQPLVGVPVDVKGAILYGWDPTGGRHVEVQVDANGLLQSAGAIAAGEAHLGEVGGRTVVFPVTLSLDTSIYASGDILADTQIMDGFFRKTDGTGIVQSIQIIDEDDVGAAFDIYFLTANVSLGTENAAPSITDANARSLLGPISVATSDYKDLGGVKVASIRGISLPVVAVSGTDDLYIAVVNGTGTPTYTAAGVRLRIGGFLD